MSTSRRYNRQVIRTRRSLRKLSISGLLVLTAFVTACDDTPTSPAPAFTQTDLRAGTGAAATAGDVLTVTYTGPDGAVPSTPLPAR